MKIKIIVGFREDQYYVIDDEEAHKAYYLFMNPEERGVFKNGVAVIGKNIQGIEPAYNETMGWNPTWKLTDDDWNEIREGRVDIAIRGILNSAKEVASRIKQNPKLKEISLFEAIKTIGLKDYEELAGEEIKKLA